MALLGIPLGLVATGPALAAGTAAVADSAVCDGMASALHQVVNPANAASINTVWTEEVQAAKQYGFSTSPVTLGRVSTASKTGLVPVKRLYNAKTQDFAWSSADAQTAALTAAGYAVQKTDFYASPTPLSCTAPVQQLRKATARRLAAGAAVENLKAAGWVVEGLAFHSQPVAAPAAPAPAPAPAAPAPAPANADTDGKFSLAIYPDTQNEVMNSSDKRLSNRNTYVAGQKTARDIRYVLHVGDVVNWDTATDANPTDHRQYDNASREMKTLESAGIPWAAAIGNHDTYAVGPTGGSARPGSTPPWRCATPRRSTPTSRWPGSATSPAPSRPARSTTRTGPSPRPASSG